MKKNKERDGGRGEKKEREGKNKMEGIALTKIADDKMKIMRNDVRASKEEEEEARARDGYSGCERAQGKEEEPRVRERERDSRVRK